MSKLETRASNASGSGQDEDSNPAGGGPEKMWLAVAIWIALVVMTVQAAGFEGTSRIAPLTFGIITTVLLSVLLLVELGKKIRRRVDGSAVGPELPKERGDTGVGDAVERENLDCGAGARSQSSAVARLVEIAEPFGWLAAAVAGLLVLGFTIGMTAFLLIFLHVYGRMRWYVVLAITCGVMGFLYLLFAQLLGVEVYEGLLNELVPALSTV